MADEQIKEPEGLLAEVGKAVAEALTDNIGDAESEEQLHSLAVLSLVVAGRVLDRPKVKALFDPEKLTNAIWDKLTTIDTGPGEGDFMASYADLKKAVTQALGVE